MHKTEEAMHRNVEGAAAENGGPTKRLRRPNVRLNQPCYVNPTHVNLQKKWNAFKKDLEGAKKARTKRNYVEKIDDDDDDLATGNWKNFKLRDLKLKAKRKRGADQEKEESSNTNGSESEKEGGTGEEVEEEENLGADGVNNNFEIKNSNQSSPIPSSPNETSSDGGEKQGKRQRALKNGDEIRAIGGESEMEAPLGVKTWLNELGLGKYESLFEVHEVDEQVLPVLTLEDLKDMGINAVGSRRKMYHSIQKLGKGFSS